MYDKLINNAQNSFYSRKLIALLTPECTQFIKDTLAHCPKQTEWGFNAWLMGDGQQYWPAQDTRRQRTSFNAACELIVSYFNALTKGGNNG